MECKSKKTYSDGALQNRKDGASKLRARARPAVNARKRIVNRKNFRHRLRRLAKEISASKTRIAEVRREGESLARAVRRFLEPAPRSLRGALSASREECKS